MEIDEMKSIWNSKSPNSSPEKLETMMAPKLEHPMFKKICLQLLIEMIPWLALILFYRNVFDGDQKSDLANAIFVFGLLQAIVVNFCNYVAIAKINAKGNLLANMRLNIAKFKFLRLVILSSRLLLMVSIVCFFLMDLGMNNKRYIGLSGITLSFGFLLLLTFRQWQRRIDRLNATIASFTAD